MTSFALRSADPARTKVDTVVVGVRVAAPAGGRRTRAVAATAEVAPGGESVAQAYGRSWRPLLATLGVTGKAGEVARVPTNGVLRAPVLLLVGLGSASTPAAELPGVLRRAAGTASRSVVNAASVALALPAETPEQVRAVLEGWLLGGYTFGAYKHDTASRAEGVAEVAVLAPGARRAEQQRAFEQARLVAARVATARDWVNTPAADLTPPAFAEAVVEAAASLGSAGRGRGPLVAATVHDEHALAELGCGGILGVGMGSAAPPRLVELRYAPAGARHHLALVGKGITYDSGGLTIKPASGMTTMKCDMAGAAAVVQATLAIAELGLPIAVDAFVPMAENMVSGSAMRPGDVLTTRSGQTVEVTNTDAEGRLILADALTRACESEPDTIIDVATLTGHMSMALGDRIGAVMGTASVVDDLVAAGAASGEVHWPMPIPEEMERRLRESRVADLLQHDWIRWGGGLYAGAFLRAFTQGRDWAHLDIAGPAFLGAPVGHLTAGGTGFTVTTLVDYARTLAERTSGAA